MKRKEELYFWTAMSSLVIAGSIGENGNVNFNEKAEYIFKKGEQYLQIFPDGEWDIVEVEELIIRGKDGRDIMVNQMYVNQEDFHKHWWLTHRTFTITVGSNPREYLEYLNNRSIAKDKDLNTLMDDMAADGDYIKSLAMFEVKELCSEWEIDSSGILAKFDPIYNDRTNDRWDGVTTWDVMLYGPIGAMGQLEDAFKEYIHRR